MSSAAKKINGYVLYTGPSLIDGSPIVAIVTGTSTSSANSKTGAMLQTWILREDVAPNVAVKTGQDYGICGDCPHRGQANGEKAIGRTCYVTVHQGPLSVWKAYKRGNYPKASAAEIGRGRMVRLGSYGDPMAVPVSIWQEFTKHAIGWTGYTHRWQSPQSSDDALAWRHLLMASADTDVEGKSARARGWRTFRVMPSQDSISPGLEVLCPASAEAGKRSTCEACALCKGAASKSRRSIAIVVHGSGARAFRERTAA